jgi:hypothetical protein
MYNTIVKLGKILLSLILMSLSPFVLIIIVGVMYVLVKLINGLTLTASISSFKVILVSLVPYFPYLTTVPVILLLLAFIMKKGKHMRFKN